MKNLEALVDFNCIDTECDAIVSFNVMQLKKNDTPVVCNECHQHYEFNDKVFINKLERLKKLLIVIKESEDILDDCSVGIKTMNGEKLVPYKLLLARLNANIALEIEGQSINFNFRLEPLNEEQQIR